MAKRKALRRSQLISPWGVGSMVNFPGDESLMTCGLDMWPFALEACPQEFRIVEERLQKRLRVSHFRLPPEFREPGEGVKYANIKMPYIRFPRWHYCPRCGSMELLSIYGHRQRCKGPDYRTGKSCHDIPEKKRPWLIPVRFLAICGQGHIEDFPFMEWVHTDRSITPYCSLRMRTSGGTITLAGVKIECSCDENASRSMAGAFNNNSLSGIKRCSGSRPWLGEIDNKARGCGHDLKVVQRGASNVHFTDVRSSIYLPRWESTVDRKIIEVLESNWELLTGRRVNGELNTETFRTVAELRGVDYEKLLSVAKKRLDKENNDDNSENELIDSEEMYRKTEYDAILSGLGGDNQDFFVVNQKADEYDEIIRKYFKSITLLHKLRETRAFIGFSRLLPVDGRSVHQKKGDLYKSDQIKWLPAIVVRGEGIFFEFDSKKLNKWMERTDVKDRVNKLISNYKKSCVKRMIPQRPLNPKFILLHTFAHLIINQLSFDCGYGSSSLRERIYCDQEFQDIPMSGILIYTASGDSEGSLGGLVRQGIPSRLEDTVVAALHSAKWCSADPVCMQSDGQGPDSCNLAACHNCALLPETCCEEGNRLLDRAMVIGELERPETGFFYDYDVK